MNFITGITVIGGNIAVILTLFFMLKNRSIDTVVLAIKEVRDEVKENRENFFSELEKRQTKETCTIYHTTHSVEHKRINKDINNIATMQRRIT